MASSTHKTILIEWPTQSGPKFKEALAGGAGITPGELLDFDGSGDVIVNVQPSGGTQPLQKMIAMESPTADTDAGTAAIDTDYADGDTVRYIVPIRGTVLYMWLKDGETSAIGDPLSNDGAGALVVHTMGTVTVPDGFIGYAAEVVAASGAAARIKVEVA